MLRRPGLSAPTFYTVAKGRVYAAPGLAPLVGLLGRRPSPCIDRLAALISLTAPNDPSSTAYEGIYRVPTHGQVRVWPDGRRQGTVVARSLSPNDGITVQEAAREIRTGVFRAISRHTEGKRRVAVLVGGGVDSSAILASTLAATRGASRVEVDAIALHFASEGDDRPYMRDLVRALGIVPIQVAPASGGALVRRMLVLDSAPYTWPNAACEAAMLLAAREQGAEIALGGMGGDDLFDGNPANLAKRAREGDALGALRDAVALRVPWREPGVAQAWDFVLRPLLVGGLPHSVRRQWRRIRRKKGTPWAGPALRAFFERHVDRPELGTESASERYARFVTLPYLMEVIDMRAQLHAGLGIARADPLLDDELIEFVSRLPPSLLLHGGRMRGLFRTAMQGLVPDSVRLRTDKAAFEPAMADAVRASGGFAALKDLVGMRNLRRVGLVETGAYRSAFDALAADPEGWGEGWLQVWPALAVETFLAGEEGLKC